MSNDTTDTTALETVVDTYLETWNETDAAKRAALIEASLGADLWYRDPMLEADGLEAYDGMIAAVQAQMPGLVMTADQPGRRPPRPGPLQLGARRARRRRRCSPASTSPSTTPTASSTASSASPARRSPPPDDAPIVPLGRRPASRSAGGRRRRRRRRFAAVSCTRASARCCGTGGRTAAAARWTWRSTSACRPGTSASSRPASPSRRPSSSWPSPSTSTSRCASATRCCSPPGTPPATRRPRSTATSMASVRGALAGLIRAHDPYPAVVVDRGWDVVMSNTGAQAFLDGVAAAPARAAAATRTASRCTPRAWRRGSRTSPSGPTTCSARSTARSRRRATPGCATSSTRCRATRTSPRSHGSWRTRDGDADRRRAAAAAGRRHSCSRGSRRTRRSARPVDITLDELHVELFHPADEATAAMVGGRTA